MRTIEACKFTEKTQKGLEKDGSRSVDTCWQGWQESLGSFRGEGLLPPLRPSSTPRAQLTSLEAVGSAIHTRSKSQHLSL